MLRTKSEYSDTKEELGELQERIEERREQLNEQGASDEDIEEELAPMVSYRNDLREEVRTFERMREGDLNSLEDLEDLHHWLIGGRLAKGWSLSDLARELDTSVQQVSRDEKKEYSGISVSRAQRILDKIGIEFQAEVTGPISERKSDQESVESSSASAPRLALADATDLQQWADTRDAQGNLPKLIRQLVLTTNDTITRVRFDAKKGVQSGGWDGIVEARESTPFIPSGNSYWELGTGKNIRDKANRDYRKRTSGPLEADPEESTFVFVSPRRWHEKDEWEREKNEEGDWNEVRAYDADDLITWLSKAPAVYAWISKLVGYPVEEVESLSDWWERWSGATKYELPPSLVIGGRDGAVEDIKDWIQSSDPSSYALQADSQEEALAFFVSSIYQLPEEERENLLLESLVIENPEAWEKVIEADEDLLLIPFFDSSGEVQQAVRNGHHVFVPQVRGAPYSSSDNDLPRLNFDAAKEAIEEDMDLKDWKENEGDDNKPYSPEKLAHIARRSLLSFRRLLAEDPSLERPEWARPDQIRSVIPALLAGRWTEGKDGDKQALSKLAGTDYDEFSRVARNLANRSDPPLRRVGGVWLIASKWDTWEMASQELTPGDMNRLQEVALDILGARDPSLDLPKDQRAWAGVKGKESPYSDHLREGIADTLALMAVKGESGNKEDERLRNRAVQITRKLFDKARGDAKLWASLSDVLPLLSEIAPDVFLDAVDDGVTGDDPLLKKVFTDNDDSTTVPFGPSSPHTGLLWALENLVWSEEHFGRSVRILAALARIDPGGRLANRPANSLRRAFVLWSPQTSVDLEERMEALKALCRHESEEAWKLMKNILPKQHDTLSPNHKPERRAWGWDSQPGTTYAEIGRGVQKVVEQMLDHAEENEQRWADLLSSYGQLPIEQQNEILNGLKEVADSGIDTKAERTIHEAAQDVISHHRSYPDADWSLPEARVQQLEKVAEQFESVSTAWKNKHLFDYGSIEQFDTDDWEEKQSRLRNKQDKVISALLEEEGLETIWELATEVEQPHMLGQALGRTGLSSDIELTFLEESLVADGEAFSRLGDGYVQGIRERGGWELAFETLKRGIQSGWSNALIAKYLLVLPGTGKTWEKLGALDSEVEDIYWTNLQPEGILKEADWTHVAEKLIEYGRPHASVKVIGLYGLHVDKGEVPPSLAVEALKKSSETQHPSGAFPQMFGRYVGELLDLLDESIEIDRETIAGLEWRYLNVLQSGHSQRNPKILHEELARDPDLFVDVVSHVFRPEDEEESGSLSERERIYARLGYKLLDSWTTVPGTQDDGTIDEEALFEWVEEAREKLEEMDRQAVGDGKIGEVLRHGPEPKDGKWPARPIRNLIEEVASADLENGLRIEVHNSRGVHSVSAEQEWSLAKRYKRFADNVSTGWPRTARTLRAIAKDFERDARRYEDQAELREDLRG